MTQTATRPWILMRFASLFALWMAAFWLAAQGTVWTALEECLCRGTAAGAAALLRLGEGAWSAAGMDLLLRSGLVVRVDVSCSATSVAGPLLAAVLAYPAPWRERLKGAIALLPVMLGMNVVRVAALAAVRNGWPSAFGFLHGEAGPLLMQGGAVLAFALWAGRGAPGAFRT